MKKHPHSNETKSLTITLFIVIAFIILAILSSTSFKNSTALKSNDEAFAGSQESIDTTIEPEYSDDSFFDAIEDDEDEVTVTTTTPRSSASPTIRASVTATLVGFSTPTSSPTPFDFFESISSPTPEVTIPPFDLNLPEEELNTPQVTPMATPAAIVADQSNNQMLIIGSVVGIVVLILVIVGIILLRKSKDNTPPPMMPQQPMDMPPTPNGEVQPPAGPQYPPYINQQQ